MVAISRIVLASAALLGAGLRATEAGPDDFYEFHVLFTDYDEAKCAEKGGSYDAQPERGTCYLTEGENYIATFSISELQMNVSSKINPQDYGSIGPHFWPVPKSGKGAALFIQQDSGTSGSIVFNVKLNTDCKLEPGPIPLTAPRAQWDADQQFPALSLTATAGEGTLTFSGSTSPISVPKAFYQFIGLGSVALDKLCKEEATFTVDPAESFFGYKAPKSGTWRFGFGDDYACDDPSSGCPAELPKGLTAPPPKTGPTTKAPGSGASDPTSKATEAPSGPGTTPSLTQQSAASAHSPALWLSSVSALALAVGSSLFGR